VNILKEEKIKAISDLKEKDDILHLQSRFATIGETLCNIEHQWRTPLSKIGVKISRLEMELDYNENPDTNLLRTITKESSNLLQHMSQTVSDFRNFYTPTSNPENFYIKDSLLKVISIMNFFTDKYHINIELKANSNPQFYGYESEFSQVILNIISNANDILLEREISNPKILITLKEIEDRIEITISDNALGINSEVIEQIFAPFYSKKSTKSTGLGLYMSKIIIEKRMLGTLSVKNIDGGTEFKILLINRDTHN
jgi:signal transduction histidine kinase